MTTLALQSLSRSQSHVPALALALAFAAVGCTKSPPRLDGDRAADAAPLAAAAFDAGGVDPEVARALEGVAQCDTYQRRAPAAGAADGGDRLDGLLEGLLCPADVRFAELVSGIEAKDDHLQTARSALTRTCARSLEHPSRSVRSAAHHCVAEQPEALAATRESVEAMLAKLAQEADVGVRRSRWKAVGALDPTAHGLAARAIEVARAQKNDAEVLQAALHALVPGSEYRPSAPEAIAFAKEIARSGSAGEGVVEVVTRSAASPDEACAIYVELTASKGPDWAEGLSGVKATLGNCGATKGKLIDAIVAHATQAKSDPNAWSKQASYALRNCVKVLRLDAHERATLRTALVALPPEQRKGYAEDVVATILEMLR